MTAAVSFFDRRGPRALPGATDPAGLTAVDLEALLGRRGEHPRNRNGDRWGLVSLPS